MALESANLALSKSLAECLSSAQRRTLIPQIIHCFYENSAVGEDGILLLLFEQLIDADNEAELTTYLEDLIVGSASAADSTGTLECAVSLCSRHPAVWQSVLPMLVKSLEQFLSCQQHDKTWIHRALSSTGGLGSNEDLRPARGSTQVDPQKLAVNAECCLHFLKTTFLSARDKVFYISPGLFLHALALLDNEKELVARAAQEMVFALFSSMNKGHINFNASMMSGQAPITPNEVSALIWNRVKEMISNDSTIYSKRAGLQLRLRWTTLPHPWRPSQSVLSQDEYWTSLQDGLRTGFAEQRKTCLYILRRSVSILEDDLSLDHMQFLITSKATILAQYERLCVVYETLVISRYINQVEECLHDLDLLASPTCLVHKSWLYALLEAALGPIMQDSIRNFTNRWLMRIGHWSEQGHNDLIRFLEVSYLSWATQGHLYTSSLVIQDQTCVCKHGQSIADFLQRLLLNFCDGRNDQISRGIFKAILRFLMQKDNTLFPYAGVYTLLGLVRWLRTTKLPLEFEDSQALMKIAARDGLAEISRDFYRYSCYTILLLSDSSLAIHRAVDSPSSLRGQGDPSSNSDWSERWPIWKSLSPWTLPESDEHLSRLFHPSVENFIFIVHGSQYKCLRGECLNIACDYLEDGLVQEKSQTSSGNVHVALEAIWNEVEIQDYPKSMLLRLPRLLLHENCLATMVDKDAKSQDLFRFVQSVIFDLQNLAETRIYVFSPLTKAIRLSILHHDQFASKFALKEFVTKFSDRPPSPKLEFLLEAATVPLFEQLPGSAHHPRYEDYYGFWDGYGYACIYDMLNRVNFNPGIAKSIFDQLVDPWAQPKLNAPVVSKWKTTLQLQVMLLIVDQALERVSPLATGEGQHYFDKLLNILSIEPLPRYRFLLECIVLRILALDVDLRNVLLRTLKDYDQSNPKCVASLTKIVVMTARLDDSAPSYVQDVMTLLVTMAASPKVMIRHEAQWSFPFLWEHAANRCLANVTENPAFAALNKYIRNLEKYMTPPPGRKIEPLDPVRDMTMCNIVQGPFLQLYPPEREKARRTDFELILADDNRSSDLPPARIPVGNLAVHANGSAHYMSSMSQGQLLEQTKEQISDAGIGNSMPIQTKGAALQANILDNLSSSDGHASSPRTSIVLIASLIKSPYNLGGLSRVAEIFGAAALHVASRTVITNKEFLTVSLTSERHLNIQETPLETKKGDPVTADVEGLAETLLDLKRNGYRIIGIEQTSESVLLGSEDAAKLLTMNSAKEAVFDPDGGTKNHEGQRLERTQAYRRAKRDGKVALVLGGEKEGIPAWILKECDACVEIPQLGVTRSLNVQTAAATVLYEYTRLNSRK